MKYFLLLLFFCACNEEPKPTTLIIPLPGAHVAGEAYMITPNGKTWFLHGDHAYLIKYDSLNSLFSQ